MPADRAFPPRVTVITLGVDDLERAVAFYRDGLGWATDGIVGAESDGQVAFFRLGGGVHLALWPRWALAKDSGLALRPASPTELSLGCNLAGPAEVDAAFAAAIAAGASGIKAPGPTFWGGYSAYIQDPDGHLWELVHNPDLMP